MGIDSTPFDLIQKLRSWFFASDRDIRLGTGLSLITQDGTDVEAALEASFITRDSESQLDDEYVLTAGTGITIAFGAGTVTISHDATAGVVPSGGVIFWPSTAGAIPSGWTTFSAASGRFLVGTDGGTFTNGSTGGAETIDIQHGHGSGTLSTDTDNHSHTSGTLSTDTDSHSHTSGTLATDNDAHSHVLEGTGDIASGAALKNITNTDTHGHDVTSGSTAGDTHGHDVTTGSTAGDTHGHDVTSGTSANALSTVQSILNPYLVGTWISKN